MSMLMILTILTYSRLDTYRTMAGIEGEVSYYMEKTERNAINSAANRLYERIRFSQKPSAQEDSAPSKNEGEKQEEKPKNERGSSRLSLSFLMQEPSAEEDSSSYEETLGLLKNLIFVLYGAQPQFQKHIEEDPDLIEKLVAAISQAIQKQPEESKIKQAIDLSNLELDDSLKEPFYLMLKGCPRSLSTNKTISESEEESADDAIEAEEFHSDKTYNSLLNFITLRKNSKVNIYIASTPLLLAIYRDPQLVSHLLQRRADLYKEVYKEKTMSAEEASSALKAEFEARADNALLLYKVTGSDPRRYE